jgi:hypothetical protein
MSLSFQLIRGLVALPVLVGLAALAWFAPAAPAASARAVSVSVSLTSAPEACALPTTPLRLALAPADLPLAHRRGDACRA